MHGRSWVAVAACLADDFYTDDLGGGLNRWGRVWVLSVSTAAVSAGDYDGATAIDGRVTIVGVANDSSTERYELAFKYRLN